MFKFYHFSHCPFSRKIRILLEEKSIFFSMISVNYWEHPKELIMINPSSTTPVLVCEDSELKLIGNYSISEYLEEIYTDREFLPKCSIKRAEVRRLSEWFDQKFFYEVTKQLLNEKIIKIHKNMNEPNSHMIRISIKNLKYHMQYLEHILSDNNYFVDDKISLSDISAAAQISVIDFIGAITWSEFPKSKNWYSLLKSRKSMQKIFEDKLAPIVPPSYYKNPDF